MTQDSLPETEEQRRRIAATRDDMGRTIAEIEERVSPSRMRKRQTEKVRTRWVRMRESVMGSATGAAPSPRERVADSAQDAQGRVSDAANRTQDVVQHAPERAESMTRGNPIAAGLIAAGLGALAGSLLPATRPERRMSTELRDEFEQPVRDELQRSGQQMQGELREHARQAAADTKASAEQAMERTRDQASDSAPQTHERAGDPDEPGRRQP